MIVLEKKTTKETVTKPYNDHVSKTRWRAADSAYSEDCCSNGLSSDNMQKLPGCYATSYAQLKLSPLNDILLLFSLFDFDSIFSIKMHRAYQPITPANNKLLKKRWDMSRYDTHRRKV